MRVVFAGTPAAALPSLDAIAASDHELAAVVTRPPAAQGRSSKLVASPVAQWARDRGIEVLDPVHPREAEFRARLAEIAPECCPVVAYGALLPEKTLSIPSYGWVNLHFSLLPAYRGAAPVQRAIMAGETLTGATTFRIVKELDAGPVYGRIEEPIGPLDTAGDLLGRLAVSGAELLVRTLDAIELNIPPVPQSDRGVTFAAKVESPDVEIDWSRPAADIAALVRGANPDPGAWTTRGADRIKVLLAEATDETITAGEVVSRRKEMLVGAGVGSVRLLLAQPPGKKPMPATDWARGAHFTDGEVLG